MLLTLDHWPVATWFGILLAQTVHLKFCKLVLGAPLPNPISGCESLDLRNKNRPQLVFRVIKVMFFSEIAFN